MNESKTPQHILVARTGSAGDALLSLPVFQTLRSSFPEARITALVSPAAKPVVQGHPAIDAIEIVEKGEGLLALNSRLGKLKADAFITLYPQSKFVLAAWLAKIPIRIGPAERWHGLFLTHAPRLNRLICDRHEVEYDFELLRPLGVTEFAKKTEFPINGVDRELALRFLRERGIVPGSPYVVVHPAGQRRVLNWKPEKYAEIARYLCQVKGLRVVVTGAPQDAGILSQVTAFLFSMPEEQKPVVVVGELGLKPLAVVYQGALCFLSGSTGPMHLAAAVGTPTVSLFSPAPEATPDRWGPWGNESTILLPDNPNCSGCQVGYCKKHDPMDGVSVPQVFNAMEKYFRKGLRG